MYIDSCLSSSSDDGSKSEISSAYWTVLVLVEDGCRFVIV